MRTCRLLTLGCKVNQYETQYVKEALETAGFREAADGEPADVCVVNTCTVTSEGDAKSRQLIRRLHQHNPDAAIVVMGCYATRDPGAVARLPGVAHVLTDKHNLADGLRPLGVKEMPRGIRRFDGHRRAFVKVQDGCLLNCTFCIIPSGRPGLRSRPVEEVADEVAGLVASGRREVVLTGIHLGHYGVDLSRGRAKSDWQRLWHLVKRLDDVPGEFRVRLSSLEAAEARDDLVRALSESPRAVPHLHLCLQSGSDAILGRMRRRYRSAGFLERCRRIRAALDRPALTTDVIVGFPGETEADFQVTCRVVREAGFAKIHVFPYSPRRGTPAAEYASQLQSQVIAERRERLMELERELCAAYCRSLIGRRLEVLVEGADPKRSGHATGTACRYVPVTFAGHAPALLGRLVPVRATHFAEGALFADPEAPADFTPAAPLAESVHAGRRVALALVPCP